MLKENARLGRAASRHSDEMVQKGYFSHENGGETFVDRILAAGYARRDDGWSLGENLAWGTGTLATPRRTMEAWMDSPAHRRTIVKRNYREIGFGVRLGVPKDPASGATVTANFGARP
ncbi:CAP domain-containing protein [Solirubrobacter sp. CPCC 204708]|uniref:CAP domain-containing protein n=1 Tax=Solirubrobacter deserti TaxID=2282478 RepID=A0ABT4RE58_9ACTN|nr:CAP domain-containing protein [Solirubrobacter deserti]MBE2314648.1 CAP domain-containing protein [Solirubrobacter deserti]MDA0136656.1 CAP domain-containing protein [Solirubrobacter deserti]